VKMQKEGDIGMDFTKNPSTDFKDIEKMSKDEIQEEIRALREGIEHHDYLYYVKNQPEISDATYDKLFRRLQDLEQAFPEFQSDGSPTRRVGAEPVSEMRKVRHTAPMLSLNAVYDENEVRNFVDFVRRSVAGEDYILVMEPKFDGVSVEVVYEYGAFQRGATRGDGETGEDVSENMKTVRAMPLRLRDGAPRLLAVRGEVFMVQEGFHQLNKRRVERGEEPFSNPRNATAGLLRQLDSRAVVGWPLDIRFYDILTIEGANVSSHLEALEQFQRWGLKTDPHNSSCSSLEEIKRGYQKLMDQREDLEYEIDGLVIKLDSYQQRSRLGTRQRSPRWALAWKFPPKKEVTVVADIIVQVGRTGMLTPVALLQPVEVGGVTISRATLHNEDEVRRKDIRVGDKVRVARAGDVIPEVVERVEERGRKRGQPFSMPGKCPVCGTKVAREGAYYFCPAGLSCSAQLLGGIVHYASREALNIEGLREKTAAQLVEKGLIKDLADLYRLSVDDLLDLEGFAQKSAAQFHKAIQSSRKTRLDRFIYALGIRHVGQHMAQVLARSFRTLDALRNAGRDRLEQIPEAGPETAASVREFFDQEENQRVLDRLLDAGVEIEEMPQRRGELPFEDKTFVFTGELEKHTRSEAKQLVESLGGHAASSISSQTDFVVVGRNPGSKLDEARRHGVKTLDEEAFDQLISQ